MKTFLIEPDRMYALARELENQSQPQALPLPQLPLGALTEFCSALAAAHKGIISRDATLRADLARLSQLAIDTTVAATSADASTGSNFDAFGGGK